MKNEEQPDKGQPKKRKVSQGPIKEKARTMRKLIDAVGVVLKSEGYKGLTVAKIAAVAGLDRKLIYAYFGDVNNLIETYIRERDYWSNSFNDDKVPDIITASHVSRTDGQYFLKGHFEAFLEDIEMQKMILWELSEFTPLLKEIAELRERVGEEFFKYTDPYFKDAKVNIRALMALQIGGIYYLSLHAKMNGVTICGIDVNQPEGKQAILDALDHVVDLCYDSVEKQQ
ncbi:TetR/AcrR family transcriptional regulator [Flavobacterium cerinum]|uniref:TetR/AcrR family transcriptional regulator n=1 Tax=Flavobacterium cerinum TaxID=2502784 RepID=A0ABY5INN7_9FLAO|nr:TetR/AcrR family transcriptional regulator [Flavobacterium cerinum]UUC43886.1 TetR/AcrR family transcriptional regulator [Flavobacterium cerinum]